MDIHFIILYTINHMFSYKTGPIWEIFSQDHGYWWSGALAPRHQESWCWVYTHVFQVVYGLTIILSRNQTQSKVLNGCNALQWMVIHVLVRVFENCWSNNIYLHTYITRHKNMHIYQHTRKRVLVMAQWPPLMRGHPFWEATFTQHLG